MGIRLVCSAPAATTTSAKPHMTFWLAMPMASSPEAQYLLTVMPGTLRGQAGLERHDPPEVHARLGLREGAAHDQVVYLLDLQVRRPS